MHLRKILVLAFLFLASLSAAHSQAKPTPDQLSELLAPIALYPDALLAQICAASTDPQQILDVDQWLHQNGQLQGQALADAAQHAGFDPAFIALVNFPQVLDMMSQNIDNYAAIGQAFAASQQNVMNTVQNLRQEAYANGALDSNQYQNVQLQTQNGAQVVVIQPVNPAMVYLPQYDPYALYGPTVVGPSVISFGAGIALGVWFTNSAVPWGWGGWGWNWGGRHLMYHNTIWIRGGRYRSPRPIYRPRPPRYTRPIRVRPPQNWNQRPSRPGSGIRPIPGRPTPRPGSGHRPTTRPTPQPTRPGGNTRPPTQGNTRPPVNRPQPGRPGGGTTRPTPQPSRPGGSTRPAPQPGKPQPSGPKPGGNTRPAPQPRPQGNTRPAPQQSQGNFRPAPQPSQGNGR